jgi:hypothetical protein
MKHNKKASGKISRRGFAKTITASIIVAPIISGRPIKQLTVHIPPIEISSGSVTLITSGDFSDLPGSASGEQPVKQGFDRWEKIEWVRVTLTDGITAIDFHRNNPAARGGKIKIWVNDPNAPMPDIVLSTPATTGGPFQVEFTTRNNKFVRDSSGPDIFGGQRYNYNGSNNGISKVIVQRANGREHMVTRGPETEIKSILIWPVEAIPHESHSRQNKLR